MPARIPTIEFMYLNHRGELGKRKVTNYRVEWLARPPEEYYPQPGWFITGWDEEKQAPRTFSLSRIVFDTRQNYMLT